MRLLHNPEEDEQESEPKTMSASSQKRGGPKRDQGPVESTPTVEEACADVVPVCGVGRWTQPLLWENQDNMDESSREASTRSRGREEA